MRKGIIVNVTAADRARLEAVVANRNSPSEACLAAKIIQLTTEGLGTNAVMRGTGRNKSVVWRWQERFMHKEAVELSRRPLLASRNARRPARARVPERS
jgi:hypothetical protein